MAVLMPKASKPLHRKSRTGSLAPAFAEFVIMSQDLMGIFENFGKPKTSKGEGKTKHEIAKAIETIDKTYIEKVYGNIENRLSFVLREGAGHFKHLLNCK